MRHQVRGRHLGRTAEHRKALLRNLVTALIEHGRIRTTEAKARELRPFAEKVISLGKRRTLHARRQALKVVGNGPALGRLFGPIAERFADRPGGYTRMIKAGRRHGDGAPIAYLELLDEAPAAPGLRPEAERGRARKSKIGDESLARPSRKAKAPGEPTKSKRGSKEATPETKTEGRAVKPRRFSRKPKGAEEE